MGKDKCFKLYFLMMLFLVLGISIVDLMKFKGLFCLSNFFEINCYEKYKFLVIVGLQMYCNVLNLDNDKDVDFCWRKKNGYLFFQYIFLCQICRVKVVDIYEIFNLMLRKRDWFNQLGNSRVLKFFYKNFYLVNIVINYRCKNVNCIVVY